MTDPDAPADPGTEADRARKSSRRRWLGLVVIAVSQLLIVLDATIINVALPALSADLEVADADRQWVVTAYTLAFGGLLLLGGRVADYLGLRRTFAIGLIGFAIACGLGGAAPNLETLLAARALQGAFGALLAPAALALVATTFTDPKERAKAFAVFGAVAGGGSAIGLILGGVLTEYANWRWTMFINVPFGIVALVGAYFLLDEVRSTNRARLDLVGTVLATSGLVAIVYSFSEAERNGWTQPRTLTLLGLGVALLISFVVSQRIVANPLLPLRVLASRTRAGANLAVLLGSIGMFGSFFYLTFYMQGVLGYSPVKTGIAFLPVTGGVILSSAVISNVLPKVRPRLVMGFGMAAAALGAILLVRIEVDSSYATDILPALTLTGLGLGCVFVPAFNAGTFGVSAQDAGIASASINTAQQVGGSLGVALLSSVAANRTTGWLAEREPTPENVAAAQVEGFAQAALVGGLILLAAAVLVTLLINVRRLEATPGFGEGAILPILDDPGPVPSAAREPEPARDPAPPRDAAPAELVGAGVAAAPGAGNGFAHSRRQGGGSPFVPDPIALPVAVTASAVPDPVAPPVPEPAATWTADGAPGARAMIGPRNEAVGGFTGPRPPGGPGEPARLRGLVRRPGGSPVADAAVTLLDAAGRQVGRGWADPAGVVDFALPGPGEFVLVARHEGHRPRAVTVHVPVVPAGAERTIEAEIALSGVARLVGAVVSAGRLSPVRDAMVTLTDQTGDVVASTRTDHFGDYELVDLAAGAYTLVVATPSSHPVASVVEITGEGRQRHDVEAPGSATVTGIARTADGRPVADARVSLADAEGDLVGVAFTDAEGRYVLNNVAEGRFTLVAVGYPPASADLAVGSGESVQQEITLAHADLDGQADGG